MVFGNGVMVDVKLVDVEEESFDGVVIAIGTANATDWFATTGSIWQAAEDAEGEGVLEAKAAARMAIMLCSNCCELIVWALTLRRFSAGL